MMVTDSCIFLMVLLLMVERWPDMLFSILLIPTGGEFVSHLVVGICLVVFSISIAILKWASELFSGAQPLLIKWVCSWGVAMAGKIALFVPWVFHRPKYLPLNRHFWVVAVIWCRSCQEEFQVEMRQTFLTSQSIWKFHIRFVFQFVLSWSHTHMLSWYIYCYCHLKLLLSKGSIEIDMLQILYVRWSSYPEYFNISKDSYFKNCHLNLLLFMEMRERPQLKEGCPQHFPYSFYIVDCHSIDMVVRVGCHSRLCNFLETVAIPDKPSHRSMLLDCCRLRRL